MEDRVQPLTQSGLRFEKPPPDPRCGKLGVAPMLVERGVRPTTTQDISEAEQVLDIMDEYIATVELALGVAKRKRYELMEHVHALRSAHRDSTPREHYEAMAAESAEVGK